MKEKIDISAVITLHAEGILAHTTLLSIQRVREYTEQKGLRVEFVLILDRVNDETKRVVLSHPSLRKDDQIHFVDYGDLSSSRNHGIKSAKGEYIGTFDGDDYFSKNWLVKAYEVAKFRGEKAIVHPELMVAFGAWNAYWWQMDQPGDYYDARNLLMINYWNACSFAKRDVYLQHPYQVSRVGEAGFGFEDWHWNCETIADGYVHYLALETLRMERRKESGSLNTAHHQVKAVIKPSKFFDQIENFVKQAEK